MVRCPLPPKSFTGPERPSTILQDGCPLLQTPSIDGHRQRHRVGRSTPVTIGGRRSPSALLARRRALLLAGDCSDALRAASLIGIQTPIGP